MHPELDHDSAPIRQFLLKLIDLIVCALPIVLTAETFQPLHHHAAVPRAIKDCKMPGLRQTHPETPQMMTAFLIRLRTRDRDYLVSARIKRRCQTLDITTFAGSIPSLVSNNNRNVMPIRLIVQIVEPLLQSFQLLLVLFRLNRNA